MLQKPTYPRIQPAHFDAHVVLDMPFDEGAGDRLLDYSGHNNHGTLVNMEEADWGSGPDGRGHALAFDGVNERVTIANSPELNPGQITIAAWVQSDVWNGQGAHLVSKHNSVAKKGYLLFHHGPTNKFYFQAAGGGVWPKINLSTLGAYIGTDGYDVAATYDGAVARIFINGILENSVGIVTTITASARDIWIGEDVNTPGVSRLTGKVGRELTILNHALSPSEVLRLVEQPRSRYRIG